MLVATSHWCCRRIGTARANDPDRIAGDIADIKINLVIRVVDTPVPFDTAPLSIEGAPNLSRVNAPAQPLETTMFVVWLIWPPTGVTGGSTPELEAAEILNVVPSLLVIPIVTGPDRAAASGTGPGGGMYSAGRSAGSGPFTKAVGVTAVDGVAGAGAGAGAGSPYTVAEYAKMKAKA